MRQGFTLLELSIVLVIIGLLIGGIFVGQSLIHTAQVNSIVTEFNRYQTAVQTFQQQYYALPGDMNNATSFWGSAGGDGKNAACQNTTSTTALTCNGNGDGDISTSTVAWDETYRFWQHLANAKLIEGSYTGVTTGSTYGGPPWVSAPGSRYSNVVMWGVEATWAISEGLSIYFNAYYGPGKHVLQLFAANASAGGIAPKDAWAIDTKYDDGKPGMGNIIAAVWPSSVHCTNAATTDDLATTYQLTITTPSCSLIFLPGF